MLRRELGTCRRPILCNLGCCALAQIVSFSSSSIAYKLFDLMHAVVWPFPVVWPSKHLAPTVGPRPWLMARLRGLWLYAGTSTVGPKQR